jgi:GntR family transcriptional regulator/MocR family aminotransferase
MTPTTTGMHCAAFLRPGLDAEAISAEAANQGLTVVPISRFCLTPIDRQGLVLGFSGFTPAQIEAGAKRLREILSAMTRRMAAE